MFLFARPPAAPLAVAMPAICAATAVAVVVAITAAAAAALAPPILPPVHADDPKPGALAFQFGSAGDGPGEFYYPRYAVMGPNGNIAVSDTGLAGGPSTQMFHPNGTFAFVLNKSYNFVGFYPDGNIIATHSDSDDHILLHPNGTFAKRLFNRGDFYAPDVTVSWYYNNPGGSVSALYQNATVKGAYYNGSAFSWTLHDPEGVLASFHMNYRISRHIVGPGNTVAFVHGYEVWVFHPNDIMPSKFGSYGIKAGEFIRRPNSVAFSPNGDVLVNDGHGRIQAFHTNGTFAGFFMTDVSRIHGLPLFGPSGEYIFADSLFYPNGTYAANLAFFGGGGYDTTYTFSPDGEFIVAPYVAKHYVRVFHGVNPAVEWQPSSLYEPPPDRGGQGGGSGYMPPAADPPGPPVAGSRFAFEIGSYGSGPGEFRWPDNVAFGPGGIIAVSDWGNNRVNVFHPNGTFAYAFGSSGHGPGEFNRPFGIAFGPNGLLAVTDVGNHRVQFFYLE